MSAIAATPARITVVSVVPLVRSSNDRDSSSMANTIPASGVLNAAATPAAPPASTSAWRCPGNRLPGINRPTLFTITAPTCTVGPSRPIEPPQNKAAPASSTRPMTTLGRRNI